MTSCSEIIEILNKKYPESLAEEWDNIGLTIGARNKMIKKILLCLDVTIELIEEAICENVDLIISHHPLLLDPIKKINTDDHISRKLMMMIENKICLYVMHTNVDIAKDGLNDYLTSILDFKKVISIDEKIPVRLCSYNEEIPTNEFLGILKKKLNLSNINIVNKKATLKNIAICTGSGKSFLPDVLKTNADAYLTGDITYHTALLGLENSMMLIDAGHYNTEIFFIDLIYELLKKYNKKFGIEIIKSSKNEAVFENFN